MPVFYYIFMNLNAIQCVIGWIQVGNRRWGLVDRSSDYIRMAFSEDFDDEST